MTENQKREQQYRDVREHLTKGAMQIVDLKSQSKSETEKDQLRKAEALIDTVRHILFELQ